MNTHQIVEAVLFASDAPLTADEIARADEMLDEDQVEDAIQFLRAEYDDAGRSFELVEMAEGHQILTRPEFAPYLERFDNVPKSSRLSGPALEALAIIAYRQPIGRVEVEYIRGVGSSGVIRTLQDHRMVEVVGRAEGLGRPLLYGTTTHFLEHFGFKSMEDLPRPDELPIVLRERISLEGDVEGDVEEEAEGDEAAADEERERPEGWAGGETVDDAVAGAVSEMEEPGEEGGDAPEGEGDEAGRLSETDTSAETDSSSGETDRPSAETDGSSGETGSPSGETDEAPGAGALDDREARTETG